jgi:hypothetical protein
VLKNVAATESNAQLKECMFSLAEKQQALSDLTVYERCCEEALMTLDDARSGILAPVRAVVADYNQAVTRAEATKSPEPIHEQRIAQAEDTLPIHLEMFEKYRVDSLKRLMESLLMADLKYHCQAVQELSQVLEAVKKVKNKI